jgi:riboflavin kinase/FMN adenylyltransferase
MIIHEGYENLMFTNPVVTLGIFDGVHSGHRALLDLLVSRALKVKGESVVITFHPHPRLVLEKESEGIFFLSTLDEKKMLMEEAGADHLVIIRFTKQFSRITACDFIEKILINKIRTRYLIIGHDHHLGYHGEGNYDTIVECASSLKFKIEQIEGFRKGEETISSSLIREALLKGRLDEANQWLGYNYSLKGTIIEGRKIGREIGFPTANIKPCDQNKLIPRDGAYAVDIQIDSNIYPGMLSVGKNPTVNKTTGSRSIEVNIFNFKSDIYGKEIEIIFRYRLRDEIRFDNTDQLARQMEKDKARAIQLLK